MMLRALLIVAAVAYVHAASGNDCSYKGSNVRYVNVSDITPDGPVYVGKAPLPESIQGIFWLVDDGGDVLVSMGGPVGADGSGECGNGKLVQESNKFCSTISTVREGGWTFQAVAKPGLSGGKYPTPADKFYDTCGTKWKFCFDSDSTPSSFDASPVSTRGLPCVNVMALATTAGNYKGTKHGGHYWRVDTKALGIIPLPNWVLGNFDMIQVMDGRGVKIQPAWDMFAKANEQIVVYDTNGEPAAIEAESLVV